MPSVQAWYCPCGTRNGIARGTCRCCGRTAADARLQFVDQQGEVRKLARQLSFTAASFAVLFLYFVFFLPGLFANRVCLAEAQRAEDLAGVALPGVQRLRALWHTARPLFAIAYGVFAVLAGLSLIGLRMVRPAPPARPRPAVVHRTPISPARPIGIPYQRPIGGAPILPQYQRPIGSTPILPHVPIEEVYARPGPLIPGMTASRRAEPEESLRPEKPPMTSPAWTGPTSRPVVPDAPASLDSPLPEIPPPPIGRPRAPIVLHGAPIEVGPRRLPGLMRPVTVPRPIWQPQPMRAPRVR